MKPDIIRQPLLLAIASILVVIAAAMTTGTTISPAPETMISTPLGDLIGLFQERFPRCSRILCGGLLLLTGILCGRLAVRYGLYPVSSTLTIPLYDLLDMLLSNMADADLNSRMKALTDEKASLKEQILEAQQEEVGLEEQVAKRQQMWDSLIECSEGYTEFDDEFIRQIIQKITVEDADTIHIQFRDSNVEIEQGLQ